MKVSLTIMIFFQVPTVHSHVENFIHLPQSSEDECNVKPCCNDQCNKIIIIKEIPHYIAPVPVQSPPPPPTSPPAPPRSRSRSRSRRSRSRRRSRSKRKYGSKSKRKYKKSGSHKKRSYRSRSR